MTEKLFKDIAAEIRFRYTWYLTDKEEAWANKVLENLVGALIPIFEEANPRFDAEKFRTACFGGRQSSSSQGSRIAPKSE